MPDAAQRARAAFQSALEIFVPEERERFVAEHCAGDEELLLRVRELLAAHEEAGDFLRDEAPLSPEIEAELARLKPEEAGERIGPYKLLEPLGEGGFGTVWLAEQEQPVKRRVALKIIKMGMDTKEVIARFQQEEQALAMMEHPNIAKVFDAGATQWGRPYFVMELVRGIPITQYCDQNNLPTAERLRLFIAVCHALQHAHQKGIIHRDLKPSNVMVAVHDGGPVPKVIDFGVAKAMQQRLTDLTVFTQFEQMIGTPLYMSPEQAEMSGLDVDTRSDIYSLGVLLYELLTGRTPFDAEELMRRGYDEIRRMIREQEPPKPSTAVSTMAREAAATVAHHHQLEPPKLAGLLRGDLDWIVMKALEKDRSRRYETANGFAMDIERHLAGEPILARPPTTFYRLGKLVRRNKLAFAAVAGVMLALFAGAGFSLWQAREAEYEAKRAGAALEDLQKTAPAFAEQARAMAAREQFDEALEKLDTAAKLRPDVAEYRVERGDLLQCQLRLAEAAAEYRAVLDIAPEHPRAQANAALCDRLLAANADPTKLAPESLRELAAAMERERRPAAQRLAVARRLGEEKKVLLDYWIERLTDLPLPQDRPLAERLTLREDGLLALDLQGTHLTDLSPLEGVPLGEINATGCTELRDLQPLRTLPLTALHLGSSGVTDLAPLAGLSTLKQLDLSSTAVRDFNALQRLPLRRLLVKSVPSLSDLTPLSGMPLEFLDLSKSAVIDLAPLRGMPLQTLIIAGTGVTNLAPLAGMPLRRFESAGILAIDFSALAGSPLETCLISSTKVRDLGFLKNAPLCDLDLSDCVDARNFATIARGKALESIKLPTTALNLPVEDLDAITALRALPSLKTVLAVHNEEYATSPLPDELAWSARFGDVTKETAQRLGLPHTAGAAILGGPSLSSAEQASFTPVGVIRTLLGERVANSSDLFRRLIEAARKGGKVTLGVWQAGGMRAMELDLPKTNTTGDPALEQGMFAATSTEQFWKQWDLLITVARPLRAAGFTVNARVLESGELYVNLNDQPIRDLSILEGAPISRLDMMKTQVSDLRPLRTMKLNFLQIVGSPVTDLSSLRGLPLTFLNISYTTVSDLSPVEGMPLTGFYVNGSTVTDFTPLAKIQTLTSILLPMPKPGAPPLNIEPLRTLPNLQRLSFTFDQSIGPVTTAKDFWAHWDGLGWMRALHAGKFKFTAEQLADGRWKVLLVGEKRFSDCSIFKGAQITELSLHGTGVTDLSPLRGLPLDSLNVCHTGIEDLSPLEGMPLTKFNMQKTKVSDLGPLRTMKLTSLLVCGSPVSDLSPLRGMLLDYLNISGCPIKDLTPLAGMPLTTFHAWYCPVLSDFSPLGNIPTLKNILMGPVDARLPRVEIEALRKLPNVEVISFQVVDGRPVTNAKDFWKHWDGLGWAWALQAGKFQFAAEQLADGRWNVQLGHQTRFSDCSIFKGAHLASLNLENTGVTDLSPLRNIALETLDAGRLQVTDISTLRGSTLARSLKSFSLYGAKITDFSPLAECVNVKWLNLCRTAMQDIGFFRELKACTAVGLSNTAVTDISALTEMPMLRTIYLPLGAREVEKLRHLPNLRIISYDYEGRQKQTAQEFWTEFDRKKKP